jgi:hypothetical protein
MTIFIQSMHIARDFLKIWKENLNYYLRPHSLSNNWSSTRQKITCPRPNFDKFSTFIQNSLRTQEVHRHLLRFPHSLGIQLIQWKVVHDHEDFLLSSNVCTHLKNALFWRPFRSFWLAADKFQYWHLQCRNICNQYIRIIQYTQMKL